MRVLAEIDVPLALCLSCCRSTHCCTMGAGRCFCLIASGGMQHSGVNGDCLMRLHAAARCLPCER